MPGRGLPPGRGPRCRWAPPAAAPRPGVLGAAEAGAVRAGAPRPGRRSGSRGGGGREGRRGGGLNFFRGVRVAPVAGAGPAEGGGASAERGGGVAFFFPSVRRRERASNANGFGL